MSETKPRESKNKRLKIELDVEDALKAALETRPPPRKTEPGDRRKPPPERRAT